MKKISVMAILIMAFSVNSFAQFSAETNVDASAYLIKAITIEKLQGLSFGNIAFNGVGDVTIDADDQNNRTFSGAIFFPQNAGTVSAAKLKVEGEGDNSFSIDMPTGVVLSNGGGNGTSSELDCDLDCSIADLGDVSIVNSNDPVEFYIGGTLFIKVGQEPGQYNGQFEVTVSYN